MSILVCALAAGLSMPAVPPEIGYFPGEYYATRGRFAVERRALESGPGPGGLLERWRDGVAKDEERVTLLLQAGAFHDPSLLPMYLEATTDPNPRVRQAAVFGYRVLIGDVPPVAPPSGDDQMRRTRREIRAVMGALRRESLVEVWLDSYLAPDGASITRGRGLILRRPPRTCLAALDQLLEPEDLPAVAEAYRRAGTLQVRLGLLRLLESLSLETFVVKPKNARRGWGPEVYEAALERADVFVDGLCGGTVEDVLAARLAAAGARWVDPRAAAAAHVWLLVLEKMPPQWWAVAARMIYRCGGPARFPSFSDPGSAGSRAARERILEFYGVRAARPGRRRR